MIDIRTIRAEPEALDAALARRGLPPLSGTILQIDATRRDAIERCEALQAERNAASKQVGEAKAAGNDAEFERLRTELAQSRERLAALEEEVRQRESALSEVLDTVPNVPLADVPDGADESDNAEVRSVGEIPSFDFSAREHFELGEALGLMDFDAAAQLAGARFVVLRGALARLHQALGRLMLDTQVEQNGYEEMWVPALVRPEVARGTGQLPKFAEDLYATTTDMWLIPTAEVPLTNLVRETILDAKQLPMRMTAWTPCFRSEAGAAGQDTRGMLRQHQFDKVEMVSITTPDESDAELERMVGCAEGILQQLELPFRTVALCTGDLGFAARKTYDVEVWLPGQARYREISSCSTCGDFQARRMQARYRPAADASPEFVHTLNGSGLAIGRALIAVMENGQQADGSIELPAALAPYMRGACRIAADGTLAE